MSHAVVIVSGGAAISPFTTPDAGCAEGQAAGSTDTFLRAGLLEAGLRVYTSPAFAGEGTAVADPGFAGFSAPPQTLPEALTVNAVGPIDTAGEHLAAFVSYLAETYGHDSVSFVAHSMGGLFSTAAINTLQGSGITVSSLTTLGTPWRGGFAADYAAGDLTLADAGGDVRFEKIMTSFASEVAELPQQNAGQQVAAREVNAWLPERLPALTGVPVTLIGGDACTGEGRMWPNDGLVTLDSALARGIQTEPLASAGRHIFADAHSIYLADYLGLEWGRALTWDQKVLDVVLTALHQAGVGAA